MKNLDLEKVIDIAFDVDQKFYGPKPNDGMMRYLRGEVNELVESVHASDAGNISERFNAAQEFGDVLFCLVSFAKQNNIDIKYALMLTITKIQERIKHGVEPNGKRKKASNT